MKSINVLLASIFLAFSASLQAQIDTLSSKTLLMKGKIKKGVARIYKRLS